MNIERIYNTTSWEEIQRCVQRGLNPRQIAEELGCSLTMLRNTLSLFGVTRAKHRKPATQLDPIPAWNNATSQAPAARRNNIFGL